jgi:hypothetical protein
LARGFVTAQLPDSQSVELGWSRKGKSKKEKKKKRLGQESINKRTKSRRDRRETAADSSTSLDSPVSPPVPSADRVHAAGHSISQTVSLRI